MYLKIGMKTKFRELHFRRRSTLHKIGEFYLSDHGRQPKFGQNSIWARSKAKIRNWKRIDCFFIYICVKPFSLTKNEGKLFLAPKSSGPLLAGLPLKYNYQGIYIQSLYIPQRTSWACGINKRPITNCGDSVIWDISANAKFCLFTTVLFHCFVHIKNDSKSKLQSSRQQLRYCSVQCGKYLVKKKHLPERKSAQKISKATVL